MRCIDLVRCAGYCRLARYRFESYLDQMGIDLEGSILDVACGPVSLACLYDDVYGHDHPPLSLKILPNGGPLQAGRHNRARLSFEELLLRRLLQPAYEALPATRRHSSRDQKVCGGDAPDSEDGGDHQKRPHDGLSAARMRPSGGEERAQLRSVSSRRLRIEFYTCVL
jgi:hypothetical protein